MASLTFSPPTDRTSSTSLADNMDRPVLLRTYQATDDRNPTILQAARATTAASFFEGN